MLTPVEEVRRTILDACSPLSVVEIPLAEALGCFAAEPVLAADDVPPFANTAMDGYAVRAADTAWVPVRLDVIGVLPAGTAPDPGRPVGPGQAIRIMTGAPMPPGADAVVIVERTVSLDGGAAVRVDAAVAAGENVRGPGTDLGAGQVVLSPGTELTPALLGVLASVGRSTVAVHARPAVGMLSTGDELVEGPAPLRPGQIYDANRPMLLALVREAGCTAVDLGRASDDADVIAATLEAALDRCDAVLLTGGVSVGDFDFVKDVLARIGGESARSWQVAMKPGKPLSWGMLRGRPVFGLPGNPVSAAVSFEVFARPALRRLLGDPHPARPVVPAVAGQPFPRRADGRLHLVTVVATRGEDGRLVAHASGGQGSHMLGALAAGNALALLPDGTGVTEGGRIDLLVSGPG